MIRIETLSKKFDRSSNQAAVDNLSLEIPEKSFFTLLGPSGCGKTTTLRCIAGLERPDKGEIQIGDMLVFSSKKGINVPPHRRRIGMVFQSYAIWPHMTVYNNVAYPLRNLGKSRTEIGQAVDRCLQLVGLKHLADRAAPLLSGGEQQRVALARALAEEPSVILLDEPLSNLDAKLREQMRSEIRDLQQKLGLTTIYVTHDQTEAFSLSDSMAVMDSGRLVELGHPEDIYEVPQTTFGAEFLGAGTILCGEAIRPESPGRVLVRTQIGDLVCRYRNAGTPHGSVNVYIRPEDISVATLESMTGQTIDAKIERVLFLGGLTEWWAEANGAILRGRSLSNTEESRLIKERVGSTLSLSIRITRCISVTSNGHNT